MKLKIPLNIIYIFGFLIIFSCGFSSNENKPVEDSITDPRITNYGFFVFIGNNDYNFIESRLNEGMDINALGQEGMTMLACASKDGNLDMVKYLLDKGADLYSLDRYSRTAFYYAMQNDKIDVFKYFITSGNDAIKRCNETGLPLVTAVDLQKWDYVKLLMEHGAVVNTELGLVRKSIDYALNEAATDGQLDNVKLLLSIGADPDEENPKGYSSLHAALYYDHEEVVKHLIDNGAYYSIHDAAMVGDLEKVKELISDNPDLINSHNKTGSTPLATAVHAVSIRNKDFQKYPPLIIWLLNYGADIEARDSDGNTLLMSIGNNNSLEVIKVLIENGADLNARNNNDISALHSAVSKAIRYEDHSFLIDIVNLLISKGADVNIKDNRGRTPLHHAVSRRERSKDIIRLLVENGANINAVDNYGNTPLHYALNPFCGRSSGSASETLEELGADRFIENYRGENSIDYIGDNPDLPKLREELSNNRRIKDYFPEFGAVSM